MSATSEFRVTASIPMPTDAFDQAEALLKHRAAFDAFKKALGEGAECDFKIVNPRNETGPRKPRGSSAAASAEQREAAE